MPTSPVQTSTVTATVTETTVPDGVAYVAGIDPSDGSPACEIYDQDGDMTQPISFPATIRPTWAEIDLQAICRNLATVEAFVSGQAALRKAKTPAVFAVLKADAYGHGILPVGEALDRQGVPGFAVSLLEEGIELRQVTNRPILVLGGNYGGSHEEVVAQGLTPIVCDLADVMRFSAAAAARGRRLPLHVKVDTGMSRLGIAAEDVAAFLSAIDASPNVVLEGICTHLASADVNDSAQTADQLARFEAVRRDVLAAAGSSRADLIFHAANSAGLVAFPESHYDLVRPGIAIYGDSASESVVLPGLEACFRLVSQVVSIREIAPGDAVSYGALFRATRPSRIATIPMGYADGYSRRLTGQAHVLVAGKRAPVVGAVCMDMFMIDVTDIPDVSVGDEVVLLGSQGDLTISARDWAKWIGTVNYEVYCGISKRVPRFYRGHSAHMPGAVASEPRDPQGGSGSR